MLNIKVFILDIDQESMYNMSDHYSDDSVGADAALIETPKFKHLHKNKRTQGKIQEEEHLQRTTEEQGMQNSNFFSRSILIVAPDVSVLEGSWMNDA